MFAECCVNYAAIEQNLGLICNTIEGLECFFELVVVVRSQRRDPGLNFLFNIVNGRFSSFHF